MKPRTWVCMVLSDHVPVTDKHGTYKRNATKKPQQPDNSNQFRIHSCTENNDTPSGKPTGRAAIHCKRCAR